MPEHRAVPPVPSAFRGGIRRDAELARHAHPRQVKRRVAGPRKLEKITSDIRLEGAVAERQTALGDDARRVSAVRRDHAQITEPAACHGFRLGRIVIAYRPERRSACVKTAIRDGCCRTPRIDVNRSRRTRVLEPDEPKAVKFGSAASADRNRHGGRRAGERRTVGVVDARIGRRRIEPSVLDDGLFRLRLDQPVIADIRLDMHPDVV